MHPGCLSSVSPSSSPLQHISLPQGTLELGARFRGTRPGALPESPLASPSYARALSLGTECCLWVVYPLQVTRVLWEILRLPWCPEPFIEYSPHLLVALLYQVFISTEQMPEEIDTFWKKCQEEHDLPTSANRCSIPVLLSLPHPRAEVWAPSMTWTLL